MGRASPSHNDLRQIKKVAVEHQYGTGEPVP
jgi:hypothetical protein